MANSIVEEVLPLSMCFRGETNLPLEIPFLQFCLAFKSSFVAYLKAFFHVRYDLQSCTTVNCSAPELHFSTCFFGHWPPYSRIASSPILVPKAGWAFGQFLFLTGNSSGRCLSKHLGVSLILPLLPVHPADRFQSVRNRMLMVLTSPSGEIVRKEAGGGNPSTRRWGDEVPFPNSSQCDGVPSSGCPMHVLAVRRVPCTWRFGIHGMGTRKYYSKGAAFADSSSPCLSSPQVSSLRAHAAVGLDVVNPGCITAPERIL